jgi:cytochrome c-type biogenesis protein CcmE
MNAKSLKIAATCAALLLGLGGLMFTSLREGTEYFKHVDEVMADPGTWQGKKVQLHGYVVEKSIERKRDSLDYRFRVHNNGQVVQATYSGIVPDTFKDGAEVVLSGELGPHGFTVAPNGVMAKCPSKYEARPGVPTTPGL